MRSGAALVLAAALSLSGRLLVAQCPDGLPPPCRNARTGPDPNSVAVLPFENRGRDTALTLLAEGLADQISTNLGAIPRLSVSSPASVRFALSGASRDPRRLGAALRAHWLVDGQVLPSREAVQVTVQLLDTGTGRVRWSTAYQRASANLLDLINAVGDSVASAIVGTLAPGERARLASRPTSNSIAYELYLRGRALLREGTERYVDARALFRSAIGADSGFADAWAAMASTTISIADNVLPPRTAYPEARLAAARALRLDPGNGEATAALAKIAMWYDWDLVGAVLLARRAVALDPRSPETHLVLGLALTASHDTGEARAELLRAIDADSLSPRMVHTAGLALLMTGDSVGVLGSTRRLLAAGPPSAYTVSAALQILDGLGRCADLDSLARSAHRSNASLSCHPRTPGFVDSLLASERAGGGYVRAWVFARRFASTGAPDRALDMLEQAFRDRESWMPFIGVDPSFRVLRGAARFHDLIARVAAATGAP